MTAQTSPEPIRFSPFPIQRVLESLARIHRWIIVMDAQRRILWMSEGLRELSGMGELALGVDARSFLAKLPRPEQIFPLRSNMRGRSHLTGAPLELRVAGGRAIPVDLDLVRVEDGDCDLLIAIATEHVARTGDASTRRCSTRCPTRCSPSMRSGFVRRANHAARRMLEASADELLARPLTALLAQRRRRDRGARRSAARVAARGALRADAARPVRPGPFARVTRDAADPGGARARRAARRRPSERAGARAAAQGNEELEHCVGALAHDLRSPLVGLLGFSRLLRQDYGDSPRRHRAATSSTASSRPGARWSR